ncbi:hypothetical protein [Tenacibaculum soleae]|uniref:hypothetical protein n=1 Tax=Tenacibaculum soleae TaxID=447689 RepID=UPI0023011738|nr:hypothetical protein [Tenacibaculum soleae]
MKSPIKHLILLVLFFSFFLFNSCNEKEDIENINTTGINTGTTATNNEVTRLDQILSLETTKTNLSIVVTDENKNNISNAEIKINNQIFTTNDTGFVIIENIVLNKEFQVITTKNIGYTTSIKTITPSNNGVTNVSITLLQPTFEATFNANDGGTVSNDNLSIKFPSNAIADQDGNLYEGEVKTIVTYYDPTSTTFSTTIPGTLVGLDDDNNMQALISKGMIKVDLTDPAGNELEIFEGKEATITLPANANDPEVIDFWHLNEEKGIWVQTGTATKVDNTYVTTVTHFSTYNLDVKVAPIDITFNIKNVNGNAIANQRLLLTATKDSNNYTKSIITDNNGEFTIINAPKGADFNLDFSSGCDADNTFIIAAGIINESTTKELIIEDTGNLGSKIKTLEGTLTLCNDEVFPYKVFTINIVNGSTTDIITAYTDDEGKYSVTSLFCYDTSITYQAEIRVFNDTEIIVKDTEIIFDNNFVRELRVCDGNIIEIDPTINNNFSDYFTLSVNQTTNILNLEVLDEDSIEIVGITFHDIPYGNEVGYYYGTTRTMDLNHLYPDTYSVKIHTNKGVFSSQFTKS